MEEKRKLTGSAWQNKIVSYSELSVSELTGHPLNPRTHPERQRQAFRGIVEEVGYIDPVIVNINTGRIIDGHMRVSEAIAADVETIPVIHVNLTEDQERRALATFDPIAELAQLDRQRTSDLLDDTTSGNSAVMQLFTKLASDAGVIPVKLFPDKEDPAGDEPEEKHVNRMNSDPPYLRPGSGPQVVICPECGCEFER